MQKEDYMRMIGEKQGYEYGQHLVLERYGYSLGRDANGYVWYAPYEVAKPLTLAEAWQHFLDSQHT